MQVYLILKVRALLPVLVGDWQNLRAKIWPSVPGKMLEAVAQHICRFPELCLGFCYKQRLNLCNEGYLTAVKSMTPA